MTRLQSASKCRFCHRICVQDLWLRERREYHVKYLLTVCPQCTCIQYPAFSPENGEATPSARLLAGPPYGPGAHG